MFPLGSPVPLCLCPALGDRDVLSDPSSPGVPGEAGLQRNQDMDSNTRAKLLRGNTEPCGSQHSSPVLHRARLAHVLPSIHRRFWLCGRDLPVVVLLIKPFSLQRVLLFKREAGTEFQLQTLTALKLHISIGLQVMSCEFMGFALHSFSPSLSLHFSLKWLS